jgi:hypothetical protein
MDFAEMTVHAKNLDSGFIERITASSILMMDGQASNV